MTEEEMLAIEDLVEYVEINDFDTDIKKIYYEPFLLLGLLTRLQYSK